VTAYKLLAVDLDGTLVRGDGSVQASDRAALRALSAVGIPVAIVTGRLYSGARPVAEELGIEGPHACVDGALVVEYPSDAEVHHAGIFGAASELVRREIARDGVATLAIIGDAVVLDPSSASFERHVRHMSPRVDHVARVLDHPAWSDERGVTAVVSIGLSDRIREAEDVLRGHDGLDVLRHDLPSVDGVSTLVLHARGVSKGTSVALLAKHYGCSVEQTVVVGDWLNDISMFRVAGRSFAMAGAPGEVCDAASDRLESDIFHGGGIAEAVAKSWPGLL
jgi:hypothetical protein